MRFQVALIIISTLTTLMVDINADVEGSEDAMYIPASGNELEDLFPASLGTKSKGKKTEQGLGDIFISQGDTIASLVAEYNTLETFMKRKKFWNLNDRFSRRMPERFIVATTHPIAESDFKQFKRDYGKIILSAMLESRLKDTYRPTLLKGAAGHLRVKIEDALKVHSQAINTIVSPVEGIHVVKRWEWADGLKVTADELADLTTRTSVEQTLITRARHRTTADRQEIQKLLRRIEYSSVSQGAPGTKKGPIDEDVALALDTLVHVSACQR
jgi:hypothetical protein